MRMRPPSSSLKTYSELKAMIRGNKFAPGSFLPSEPQLASAFGIARGTLRVVLSRLEKEGILKRVPGKGAYITDRKFWHPRRRLGILLPVHEEIYGDFSTELSHFLEDEDIEMVTLGLAERDFFRNSEKTNRRLFEQVVSSNLDGLIFRGTWAFPFYLMAEYKADLPPLYMIISSDTSLTFPGINRILVDWRAVGRLAAEHLYSCGHRRFALQLSNMPLDYLEKNKTCLQRDRELEEGILDTLQSHGISRNALTTLKKSLAKEQYDELFTLLKSGTDGIVLNYDFQALPLYNFCRENLLTPGVDIGIVGQFNTTWCDVLYPKMTSVSINIEKIASQAAMLFLNNETNQELLVEPELIVRKT